MAAARAFAAAKTGAKAITNPYLNSKKPMASNKLQRTNGNFYFFCEDMIDGLPLVSGRVARTGIVAGLPTKRVAHSAQLGQRGKTPCSNNSTH